MVNSSDFEAFYRQEVEKANRVLPLNTGLATAPSRYLFFENQHEAVIGVNEESDYESTLQNEQVFYNRPVFHASHEHSDGIETFSKFPQGQDTATRNILNSGVSSAHGKEECTGSKTTCFESPYWPGGQHEFKSRGLLDSASTMQLSGATGTVKTNLNPK